MPVNENTTQEVGRKSSAVIGCWSGTLPTRPALVQGDAVMYLCVCLHLCLYVKRIPSKSLIRDLTWTLQMFCALWCVICLDWQVLAYFYHKWLIMWWITYVNFTLSYNFKEKSSGHPSCFIVDDAKWSKQQKQASRQALSHTHSPAYGRAEQPEGVQQLGSWSVILSHLYSSPFWTLSTFLWEAAANECNITILAMHFYPTHYAGAGQCVHFTWL